jgi:hypothetical protein
MSSDAKPAKRKERRHKRVSVILPTILVEALDESAGKRGVTLDTEVQIAIEEHLKAQGITYWQSLRAGGY